jgi:hypothetical protein
MPPRRPDLLLFGVLTLTLLAPGRGPAQSGGGDLPRRPTERPLMTTSVPHMQVNVTPRPSVHDLLFRSAFALPDVENYPANVVGARTIWLPDALSPRGRRSGLGGRGGAGGPGGGFGGVGHIDVPPHLSSTRI